MGFEELWDGFEKVCKRSNDGEQFVGAILRYFTKRQKLELDYAKALDHLADGMKEEQEIGTTKEMWTTLQAETKTLGEERTKCTEKLMDLTTTVANDLREGKRNRTVLVTRGQKLVTDLAATEAVMKKARTKYCDARKLQQKSIQTVEKAKSAGSNVAKLQKDAEKNEKRAEKSDNEYRISVNNLKGAQDKFYESDMPALLKDFQEHERMRLEKVREYIQKFIDLWTPLVPSTKSSIDRFQGKLKEVDIQSDLNLFVEQNRPESDQPPPRAQYISYDGSVVQDAGGSSSSSSSSTAPAGKEKKDKPEKTKEKPEKFRLGLGKKKDDKHEGEGEKDGKEKDKDKDKEKKREKDGKTPTKQDSSKNLNGGKIEEKEPAGGKAGGDDEDKKVAHASIATATVTINQGGTTSSTTNTDSNTGGGGSGGAGSGGAASSPSLPKSDKSDKADSELVELMTIYAYDATEDNELTFGEGEIIYLIEKDDSGWWRGRNKKGVEGVFPSNFVEVVGEEGGGASGTVDINADYTALYDYEAEDETELTIKEGEILHVISETDGWYFGTNAQGQKGNFPSNFVERLENKA